MNSTERLMKYLDALGIKYESFALLSHVSPDPTNIKIYNENNVEVFSSYQLMTSDDIDVRDDFGYLQIPECVADLGCLTGARMSAEKAMWYIKRWYFGELKPCENHNLIKCGKDFYMCKICKAKFYKENVEEA